MITGQLRNILWPEESTFMKIDRALSIQQPFAWAVVANVKKTENRTWHTDFRGTIAIHASTSFTVVNAFRKDTGCEYFSKKHLTFGAIIGFADVIDVSIYGPAQENDPFACGPYCWTMANGRFLKKPIPLKGKLNLFKLDPTTIAALAKAETFEMDLQDDPLAKQASHAMTGEPDPFECYAQLCDDFLHTPDYQHQVAIWADRMIEQWPDLPEGYANKSFSELSKDEFSNAYALAKKAVELDPEYAAAQLAAAQASQWLDKKKDAYKHITRFVELAADDSMAYVLLAQVHTHFEDYEAAANEYQRSLSMTDDNPLAYEGLIGIHRQEGRMKEAKRLIEQALSLWPDDEVFLNLRSEIAKR